MKNCFVPADILLPAFAQDAAKAGYGINMWTINDEATIRLCLAQDVGIITNYPDVAVSLRAQKTE